MLSIPTKAPISTTGNTRPKSGLAMSLWLLVSVFLAWTIVASANGQENSPGTTSDVSPPRTIADQSVKAEEVPVRLPVPAAAIDDAAGRVRYIGPDTYILLDAEGRPQPMPGMTYEDFMAAWKQSRQADAKRHDRRYSIESLNVRGRAFDRYAELRLQMNVRLLTTEEVSIQLGLGGAILVSKPQLKRVSHGASREENQRDHGQYEKSLQHDSYVDYDPKQRAYLARLSGDDGQRYTLTMELLLPIEKNAASRAIETSWPRALTSELVLEVDTEVDDVSVNEGAVLSQEAIANHQSRITVVGLAGQFRLAWSAAQVVAAEPATVLSATGAMLVTIDGRSVQTEARISVQSFGGEFDRFRVLLPAGAKLIQDRSPTTSGALPAAKMRISVESRTAVDDGLAAPTQERQVVLVELQEKQQGPVEIKLLTEQPIGLLQEESSVELAGFEVVGAVRQFGDIALRAANDWQLRWELGGQVRQVDAVDLDPALQESDVTAAFQYDRQPWSLDVTVTARQSRVHVTPEYALECLADEARLKVRLIYQVLGARTFEFRVDLQDWELTADPIESNGLVDPDRVLVTREGILLLPLVQAATRRAEIVFNLRRSTPRDSSRVRLPLPTPHAESIGSGTLMVRSSPGIELVPDSTRLPGLAPLPISPSSDAPGIAELNQFRYRSFSPDAEFIADRITRSREVVTVIETSVELSALEAQVTQQIDYEVRYEPIKDLVFEVPEELLVADKILAIAVSNSSLAGSDDMPDVGMPLTVTPLADEYRSTDIRGARRLRASIPQALLGRFTVKIEYPLSRATDSSDGEMAIPLVRPVDCRLDRQRAIVYAPRELSVALSASPAESSWRSPPRIASRRNTPPLELFATHGELQLPLTIRSVDFDLPSPTTIDRVWLQTWLTRSVRQDRASYQFRSKGADVTVELPPGMPSDEVEVLLDGRPPKSSTTQSGRIVVALPASWEPIADDSMQDLGALHTLEVRYRQPIKLPLVARHRLSPPQLVGGDSLAEIYWQIVAPGDHHIIRAPRNLSSTSQWQWLGGFWGWRATKSQADLEEWIGAAPQLAPTNGQNEYLYSGLTPVASTEIVTAPRWLIVLVASVSCLLIAMAWIYVPLLRQGWIVLALACALVGAAIAYPIPAMLLGQAAALGVVLSVLAVLISRLVARPVRFAPPARNVGSTLGQVTPRADSHMLASAAPAASTSPAAPMHLPESGS